MTATTSRKTETKTAKATTQKLRIHFADGNKGGVGKSFLARTLYQYCLDRKLPTLGVEADIDSPDFKGIYKEAAVSRFSENEILLNQANDIVNWAIEQQKNLVVNLPATVHKAFDLWLRNYNILDLAKTADVELVKWFVCTGEYDSMKSLGVSLKTFGKRFLTLLSRISNIANGAFLITIGIPRNSSSSTTAPSSPSPNYPSKSPIPSHSNASPSMRH